MIIVIFLLKGGFKMEQSLLSLRLKQEVIESGNCTRCGLCVGMCPYIKTLNERIAFIHDCGREDGNCYRICPRTPSDWPELDRQVFGQEREDHILGHYQEVLYARSLDKNIAQGGQYGGVVSSLASYLIDSGESQAAILTKSEDYGPPKPFIAELGKKYFLVLVLIIVPVLHSRSLMMDYAKGWTIWLQWAGHARYWRSEKCRA